MFSFSDNSCYCRSSKVRLTTVSTALAAYVGLQPGPVSLFNKHDRCQIPFVEGPAFASEMSNFKTQCFEQLYDNDYMYVCAVRYFALLPTQSYRPWILPAYRLVADPALLPTHPINSVLFPPWTPTTYRASFGFAPPPPL